MDQLKELIKALNKDFYKKSFFSDLENAFFDVYRAIIAVLNEFLLTPLNEDINDVVDIDNFIKEYKVIVHNCLEMIKRYNDRLTMNKNEHNDSGFTNTIDVYSKYIYTTYDVAIRQVNSENALKINNMIFAYQMLLRFFNNMLLSHSNYKGKLVNVEKPLVLNINVVDVEKFLATYTNI